MLRNMKIFLWEVGFRVVKSSTFAFPNGGAAGPVSGAFFEQDGDEQQTSRRLDLSDLKTGPGQTKETREKCTMESLILAQDERWRQA